jgi:hypothetical protein
MPRSASAIGKSLLDVASLALMPDGQDQHDVFCGEPAILGDVAVAAARKYELAAALLGFATQQRVVGQQFERAAHTQELFAGAGGILFGDEVEETLEIS